MDNIIDYLKWMGRFSFEELEFSEADAIVLCEASYFDLKLFGQYTDLPLKLSALYDRIASERHVNVNISGTWASASTAEFFKLFAKSRRFSDLRVIDYVEHSDREQAIQFSAVTFEREGDFSFIAFRGTDDTMTGWKEDFMICFQKTQAQSLALEYAKEHIKDGLKNYIGGHSKGGNMALYACCMLSYELWDKIEQVYLLDAPGLCEEVMNTSEIARVNRKTTSVRPAFCVIGKLFEPKLNHTIIVDSPIEGVMQHDLFSWGIDHGRLKRVREFVPESENLSEMINGWVSGITIGEREVFVNELFDNLAQNGCATVEDFSKLSVDTIENIAVSMLGTSASTKRAVASLPVKAIFGDTFRDIRRNGFVQWVHKNVIPKSIAMILVGVFCIIAPDYLLELFAKLVFVAVTVAEMIFTVKQLIKAKWNFLNLRYRMYLCISMIIVCIVVLLRDQAMYILGSVLFGVVAMIVTFVSVDKAIGERQDLFKRIVYIFESVVSGGFGIAFLIIPSEHIFRYIFGVGIALIIDGVFRLVIRYVPFFRDYRKATKKKKYYT